MTLLEAVRVRSSRRRYLEGPIDYTAVNQIKKLIEGFEHKQGLNIQLVFNDGSAFNGLRKSYGMFTGVQHYFVLIENKKDTHNMEKLGYYGEWLVLAATTFNLGTCWVAGTFDRASCPVKLSEDERIACVITLGNVPNDRTFKEKMIYTITHRKTKTAKEMMNADSALPEWFMPGMEAVQKAPSAVNRQPVIFSYKDGLTTASVKDMNNMSNALDMGIAKFHFMLGASGGRWDWGNGARFHQQAGEMS